MAVATVATVATQATNARVGAHAPACVGAHAGSALHARYRGARTREQPDQTGEVFSPVAPKLDPRPRGDGSSQRAKTRDRGAAQFMRMKWKKGQAMQAELFTDEDLLALAPQLPQSGKTERSSLESAYRCIDYRAFADSRERLLVIQGGERMDFLDAIRLGTIASGKTVRLFVCTAFLNREGADAFCEMAARGFVESAEFLLGWNRLKSKEAATVSHMRRAFKSNGLTQPRIHFARHHSKFVIATDCKTDLPLWVIISSANINENRRTENYLISASPLTAQAYLDFFRAHLYIRAEGSQQ